MRSMPDYGRVHRNIWEYFGMGIQEYVGSIYGCVGSISKYVRVNRSISEHVGVFQSIGGVYRRNVGVGMLSYIRA